MENALIEGGEKGVPIRYEPKHLSASEVRQHINLIQEVMRSVMIKETHYGIIPGCKQPSLLKPGSEVLLTTFRIAVDPEVEDLSTPDEIRYRVKCKGIHQTTGVVIGVGIGECSSNEDKYKFRKMVCQDEFDATPETMRRVKYAIGKGGSIYTVKQVRTNPADLANTILKMAKKRAQVDLTLTGLSASDVFTQDIEDLPDELRPNDESGTTSAKVEMPSSKKAIEPKTTNGSPNNNLATDGEKKFITNKLESLKIPLDQALTTCGLTDFEKLTKDGFIALKEFCKEKAEV